MKTVSNFKNLSDADYKAFNMELNEAIKLVAANHGVKLTLGSLGRARYTDEELWFTRKLSFAPLGAVKNIPAATVAPSGDDERMKLLLGTVGHEYKIGSRNMTVLEIVKTGEHAGKARVQTRRGKKYVATLEQLLSWKKNY